jgi:hypothetical protein
MKKLLVGTLMLGCLTIGPARARAAEQTWTGVVSDSLCGASHEAMRQKGQKVTDRECTVACVNYQTPGAPKFVFVTGGKVYPIKNQAFGGLGRRSGTEIVLTGDLDSAGEITITTIAPAKK